MLARPLEALRERITRPGPVGPDAEHLAAALEWLYRAHDAGGDGGVSHGYRIGAGWLPSYPETTGYIIPTLLTIADARIDAEARRRALRMAEWELAVQLPNGAIPDLVRREPVVFDTAQVVFGWLAAYRASGEERYLGAARAAGRWLLEQQDADGAWRRATGGAAGTTFYARAAWALAELGEVAADDRCREGARRCLGWCLSREEEDGWFADNCLTDVDRPLLHTIAYTAQGLLESGVRLGDSRLIEAAARTGRALAARVTRRGWMAGRYARGWKPAAGWACLTGVAQMSIVWSRLHHLAAEPALAEAAARAQRFLKSTQDLRSKNPGLRGGIRGSFPVHAPYQRYAAPNWATKFFLDALLHGPAAGVRTTYAG